MLPLQCPLPHLKKDDENFDPPHSITVHIQPGVNSMNSANTLLFQDLSLFLALSAHDCHPLILLTLKNSIGPTGR